MEGLGASQADLQTYQALRKEDLSLGKDILEPGRTGQRSDTLAWIWYQGPVDGQRSGSWLNESEWFYTDVTQIIITTQLRG
jgi:hypothetical protein